MSDVTLPGSVGSEPVLTSHWLTWPRFIADLMSGLCWVGGARPRICCTAYSLPRRPRARSSASSCVRWSRPSSASDHENNGLAQQPLSASRVEQEMEVTDDILFTPCWITAITSLTLTAAAAAEVRAGSSPRPPVWASPPAPYRCIII